jgi:hypothetical protein
MLAHNIIINKNVEAIKIFSEAFNIEIPLEIFDIESINQRRLYFSKIMR